MVRLAGWEEGEEEETFPFFSELEKREAELASRPPAPTVTDLTQQRKRDGSPNRTRGPSPPAFAFVVVTLSLSNPCCCCVPRPCQTGGVLFTFLFIPFQWLRQAVRNAELKRGASAQVFLNPPASLCATAHLTAALVCFPSDKRAIG